jgi:hypothetical protein
MEGKREAHYSLQRDYHFAHYQLRDICLKISAE